jgi:hypothetical protein
LNFFSKKVEKQVKSTKNFKTTEGSSQGTLRALLEKMKNRNNGSTVLSGYLFPCAAAHS